MPKSKYDILNVGYGVLNPMSDREGYDKLYDPDEAGFFGLVRQTTISHFAPNISNMGPLIGICLRFDGYMNHGANASSLTWAQKHAELIEGERPPRLMQIRVRIPEIHSWLPIPRTLPLSAEKHKDHDIINMYPLFISQTENIDGGNPPGRGELVWVDFQNKETLEGPIYLGQVRQNTATIPTRSNDNAKDAHRGKGGRGKGGSAEGGGSAAEGEIVENPTSNDSIFFQGQDSDGIRFRNIKRSNQYAIQPVLDALKNLGVQYKNNSTGDGGDSILIGDMSKSGGGQVGTHKSHKHGTDVDIGFPWKVKLSKFSDNSIGENSRKAWVETGQGQMNWDNLFSLVDLLFQVGAETIFMNDAIAEYSHNGSSLKGLHGKKKVYNPSNVSYAYNHFHVKFPKKWYDEAEKIAEFNGKAQNFYA
jgi:hypothetical protein